MRKRGDVGETLVEIVLTIVIIGLTITALISSLATVGNAGNLQRISVQTDVVLRNYAEATKAAAQSCVAGGSYTVDYSSPGYTLSVEPADHLCPNVAAPQLLNLLVIAPTGLQRTLQIRVGTP